MNKTKMIVITTHNGIAYLRKLLSDIESFNIKPSEICIVDNDSTNKEHLDYIKSLRELNYNVLYNPIGGYNVGGYKYALDNLKADVWFLIQDSIRIKTDIFSEVIPKLTNKNVWTFLTFHRGLFDDSNDIRFMMEHYKTTEYEFGCFPHSYFATNEVLQKVKNEWVIPKNKIETCAMERGIPIVFKKYDISIHGLGMYEPATSGDPDAHTFFSKTYGGREH
jgi:GT2 family glycosyltransferase